MFGFLKRKERLKFACVTASEKWLVRKDNQDAAFVDEAKTVFCVADGMGGGSEGATASRIICSDGVHDVVADARIGEILTAARALPSASKQLGDEIVRNGAPDNYTFLIVETGGVI